MISTPWRPYRTLLVGVDAVAVAVAYVVADVLRCWLRMGVPWPERIEGLNNTIPVHFWVLAVLPVVWPLILAWHGWYEPRWRSWLWLTRRAVAAAVIQVVVLAAVALVFQRELYPRAQLGFFAAILPATTLLARSISGLTGQWLGARQPRHVLIVGTGRQAVRLRRLLRSVALGRSVVIGHLRLPGDQPAEPEHTGAILGGLDRLAEILDRNVVDEVLFAVPLDDMHRILPYVALCEEVGVTAALPAHSTTCRTAPTVVDFHGVPLLTYGPSQHAPELLWVKRGLDVAAASLILLLTWPILLLCAVLVRCLSSGPILFRQVRIGLHGRPFTMYKFRTMQIGAEARQSEVSHLNEADGPVFKSRRDPRVTRIGMLLRKYCLDEMPQLFNVLRGDMAIVGPRPPLPDEVAQYDRWQRRRLSMRPGLTCLWQINGAHRVGFDEWMALDLFYIDHWSLRLDLLIVCKTIVTVLSGSSA